VGSFPELVLVAEETLGDRGEILLACLFGVVPLLLLLAGRIASSSDLAKLYLSKLCGLHRVSGDHACQA
jgi:hypothetical protein